MLYRYSKVLIGYLCVYVAMVFSLPLHLDRAKWRIMVASSAMPSTGVVPLVKELGKVGLR